MPIMSNEQSKHIMVKDITHEYIVQLFMITYMLAFSLTLETLSLTYSPFIYEMLYYKHNCFNK